MTLQSTINNSAYHNAEEDDTEKTPNSYPKVATYTSDGEKRKVTDNDTINRNSLHKLLIKQLILEIIPVIIPPIDQTTADGVALSGETLHAHRTVILKEIVTDATQRNAHVFKYPPVVNWIDTDMTIPQDGNTVGMPPILNTPVRIGAGPSVSPTRMGSQNIGSPRGSISPQ